MSSPLSARNARFAALACATAAAITLLAVIHADRAGRVGADLLGALDGGLDRLAEESGELYAGAADAVAVARLPAGLLLLAALAVPLASGRSLPAPLRLGGALGLGWIAQSYLADARIGTGVAVYVVLAALYLARREEPVPLGDTLPLRVEVPLLAIVLGVFAVLCLHRLDVYPPLYFDETAYLTAAHMQLGELQPGPIEIPPLPTPTYHFERFHAQSVPFFFHTAAVGLLSPGVLAPRLSAVAAGIATLVIAAIALRPHLGARGALTMTALCAVSPLFLAYSRPGFYLALSMTHGALCLAATLRLARRWDRSSALLLGGLLGASLYFYQLSWFAPLLSAGALVAAGGAPPGRERLRPVLWATASALLVTLPALLWLRPGLEYVGAQTFPRLRTSITGEWVANVRGTDAVGLWHAVGRRRELLSRGLSTRVQCLESGQTAFRVFGAEAPLVDAAEALRREGWAVSEPRKALPRPIRNLKAGVARLFHAPGCESSGRRVTEPILTHVLAPLVALGLLEALRRRRSSGVRSLVVWVGGAALLPMVVVDDLPRRTLLMLPFVYALAALPLLEAWRGSRGPAARAAVALVGVALLSTALCVDLHSYFERWYVPPVRSDDPRDAGPDAEQLRDSFLQASRGIKALPRDEEIVLLPGFLELRDLLRIVDAEVGRPAGGRITPSSLKPTPGDLWRQACRTRLPFTWIGADGTNERERFASLPSGLRTQVEVHGRFRFVRVVAREPGACEGIRPLRPSPR